MMAKAAYFDCFSGISGDMCVASLIDAGVPFADLERELRRLPLDGWAIRVSRVRRHTIAATLFDVESNGSHGSDDAHHPHRGLADILGLLGASDLSDLVLDRASRVFSRLAEAEAAAHDVPMEQVHFHEVGAVDSIVDVVGACICLDILGVEEIIASPLPMSRGFVKCEHGLMPVPVPGTLELLKGVPVISTDLEGELVTPTGAAIVTTLASEYGAMPEMVVESIGYGAGHRDLEERPNMLRVVLGSTRTGNGDHMTDLVGDCVMLIETNIDDQSPETFGYVVERLLAVGALDAYYTPIYMKKGRPAYQLSAMAEMSSATAVIAVIMRETSTFGVRTTEVARRKLARDVRHVQTPYGTVRVKCGAFGSHRKVAPEFEDCRDLARRNDVPIRDVYDAAVAALTWLDDDSPPSN